MSKHVFLSAAIAAAYALPACALAAPTPELAALQDQIRDMKQSYETRLQALERRLQELQAAASTASAASTTGAAGPASAAPPDDRPLAAAPLAPPVNEAAARAGAGPDNRFNPSMSLILGGSFQKLQRDPGSYRLGGFLPSGGEVGPGSRSFNLGESELTLAANIDPLFAGQLTFALSPENEIGVEEAFVRTRELGGGWTLAAGRFLSGIGYLNGQHSHTWNFADAPLAYQAMFGGQFKQDGVQARWLAPLNTFVELGAELGSGRNFPGNDRNKNGSNAASVFVHAGDDIGESASWRAGLSYLRTGAVDRAVEQDGLVNAFTGRSSMWIADAVLKWAPNGNPTRTNFKLQGEYLRRSERGSLSALEQTGDYAATQSGWYLEGVYQFMPNWRTGLRYDRLAAGNAAISLVSDGRLGPDSFPALAPYTPQRSSVMLDYSPTEFSRLRLQFARDQARPGEPDNQLILQYIMSLGAHAGHAF